MLDNPEPNTEAPGWLVKVDVLIVGSGPIGAVFARSIFDAKTDIKILMVDIGPQHSLKIGDHQKNSVAVQKDISLFTNVVIGQLQPLSVPTGPNSGATDQTAYTKNGQNPNQNSAKNLTKAAASRVVGGMGSHWTCCTPRQHTNEQNDHFAHVYKYYGEAEKLFNTKTTEFDHSIRQQLVMHTLATALPDLKNQIQPMPLACSRPNNTGYVKWTCPATILGPWSDPQYSKKPPDLPTSIKGSWRPIVFDANEKFRVWPNTQCVKLNIDKSKQKVISVKLKHLLTNQLYDVEASKYVICAGAILTPGILINSGLTTGSPNHAKPSPYYVPQLGKNLTEQTMAFCQVKLWKEHVESVMPDTKESHMNPHVQDEPVSSTSVKPLTLPNWGDFWESEFWKNVPQHWIEKAKATGNPNAAAASWKSLKGELKQNVSTQLEKHKTDPLPFPANDPDPQCYYPYTVDDPKAPLGDPKNRPWHTKIHRDAFGYGQVPANIDQRRVVDLRWFGYTDEDPGNYVEFSTDIRDEFGMPQPTFHYTETKSKGDKDRQTAMLAEMKRVGFALGSWIKGAEPQALPQGSALHICGTYKAGPTVNPGADSNEDNEFGQMWNHKNVVLGGCGVIPNRNACNPTLTAACFAIHAAKQIVRDLHG